MQQSPGYIPYEILTDSQKDMVDSDDMIKRIKAARLGYGLDKLVKDDKVWVRREVASNRRFATMLVDDEDLRTTYNAQVAIHGFVPASELAWIDAKLIESSDVLDRRAAAKARYGSDVLKDDDVSMVRAAVARTGLFAEDFAFDDSSPVRTNAVKYGSLSDSTLEKLAHDEDVFVRQAVAEIGHPHAPEWFRDEKNPYINRTVEKMHAQHVFAEKGYVPYDTLPKGVKEFAEAQYEGYIASLARNGLGVDVFVENGNPRVRKAVAESGYGLDKLANDTDPSVRAAARAQIEERGSSERGMTQKAIPERNSVPGDPSRKEAEARDQAHSGEAKAPSRTKRK